MVRSSQLEPASTSATSSIPLPRSHKKPGSGTSPALSRRSHLPKPNVSTPTLGTKSVPKGTSSLNVPEERPLTQVSCMMVPILFLLCCKHTWDAKVSKWMGLIYCLCG